MLPSNTLNLFHTKIQWLELWNEIWASLILVLLVGLLAEASKTSYNSIRDSKLHNLFDSF